MSFKDLELEIAQWVEAGLYQAKMKREAEARKEYERNKRKRPPLYIPDRAPRYDTIVKLNVRRASEGNTGDLLTVSYTVDTISETQAEIEAKKLAKADGYMWRGTVSIKRKY